MATGNIKNFEWKLGKTGLITIIIGMVALLFVAFLFGIEVGKNIDVYPGKIAAFPQKILALIWKPAKIKVTPNSSENKSAENQTKFQEENIDLTFFNALTSKKGAAIPENSISDKQSAFTEMPIGNFKIDGQKTPEATTVGESQENAEQRGREITTLPVAERQKFTIQVASMKDKNKANKIVNKLNSLGFSSQVVKVEDRKKGTLFRVVIPGFEDKVQAQMAVQKISQKTAMKNCIIKSTDNER